MSYVKTIKSLMTRFFTIELVELPNNNYCVFYEVLGEKTTTGEIKDFNTASSFFDDTLMRMQGH